MTSLLDALGAAAIGGLFIITMLTAMFNIQAEGFNATMAITTTRISEEYVNLVDSLYMAKVGLGAIEGDEIITADENEFVFITQWNYLAEPPRLISGVNFEISIVVGDETDDGYPLTVHQDNEHLFGPIYLSENDIFTYYDVDENETTTRAEIRSARVQMAFRTETYRFQSGPQSVSYRLTFWKYFKNLYL